MNTHILDNTTNPIYHWSGKFIAPSEDWIHLTRALTDYELMVVTEGELHISDGQKEYRVLPGEYLLMGPTPYQHGVKNSYCEFMWLHFHVEGTAKMLESTNTLDCDTNHIWQIPAHGQLAFPDRIIILMKQLQDMDRRYRNAPINSCFCGAILGELHLQNPRNQESNNRLNKEQFYQDIVDYIEWHISENIRVSKIADYFGYNEKYLTTFFGNIAGISLKQYILQRKMEQAKAALSETNQPVSQIGYALGFSDAHNFSHAFKKIVGVSPVEYRKSFSKRNVFQV